MLEIILNNGAKMMVSCLQNEFLQFRKWYYDGNGSGNYEFLGIEDEYLVMVRREHICAFKYECKNGERIEFDVL